MTDVDWIGAALAAARPQAIAALLRYFRDLDTAEEAFQEACLARAEDVATQRDRRAILPPGSSSSAATWRIDSVRKRARQEPLPEEALISDLEDAEAGIAEQHRPGRTTATTCCGSCSSAAIPICRRRSRSRSPCASSPGLSVKQIARAFLVGEAAMEQRITRAKAPHRRGRRSRSRRRARRSAPTRLAAVAAMIYLVFNEGYSASGGEVSARAPLCEEAIRLARLLLRLFPAEPEIMGLLALLRAAARARGCALRRERLARAAR